MVQFLYRDMIDYLMKDDSAQFLYLQNTKLLDTQEFKIILRVIVKPRTSQYPLTYFIVLNLDMLG